MPNYVDFIEWEICVYFNYYWTHDDHILLQGTCNPTSSSISHCLEGYCRMLEQQVPIASIEVWPRNTEIAINY